MKRYLPNALLCLVFRGFGHAGPRFENLKPGYLRFFLQTNSIMLEIYFLYASGANWIRNHYTLRYQHAIVSVKTFLK